MNLGVTFDQFRSRLRGIERRHWVIGGLSVLMTTIIMVAFLVESRFGYLKPDPIVAYFKNWEDGRSRSEALSLQEDEQKLEAEAEAIAAKLDIGAAAADKTPIPK